jgi:hypothetical protein
LAPSKLEDEMASGNLIAESLRVGASLHVSLQVQNISRAEAGDESVGQPRTWTFIAFQTQDTEAESLAQSLEDALDAVGGWYCDFRTEDETFVTFAGRTFRYPRGVTAGRAEAAAYARSVGVPEAQIDWRE